MPSPISSRRKKNSSGIPFPGFGKLNILDTDVIAFKHCRLFWKTNRICAHQRRESHEDSDAACGRVRTPSKAKIKSHRGLFFADYLWEVSHSVLMVEKLKPVRPVSGDGVRKSFSDLIH